MKILLIQPPQGTTFGLSNIVRVEPLGLECVGGALEEAGHDVKIIDMRLDGWTSLRHQYSQFGPDAAGVACQFTTDVYPALQLGLFLRTLDADVLLFAGGHHASLQTGDLLFPDSPYDALVVGEGELTAVELINAMCHRRPLEDVHGVMTTKNQATGFVPRRMTANLNLLPLPARHLANRYRAKYHQGHLAPSAAVETSRGCPFDCNFCSVWVFYARRARRRHPDRIMLDLESVTEEHIFFTDDIAFIHRPSYEELGERIKAAGIYRNFAAETRADLVVKYHDMFDLWRSVGMGSVFLGVEKIDDAGLASVRKRTNPDVNALAIRILQDKGIRPIASFIVDPRWAEEDFDRLEAYLDQMNLEQPSFAILTPLPGTELYVNRERDIVTRNYLLYDVMHTVLPTRLPIERFYERFARLYRLTARKQRLGWPAVKAAFSLHLNGRGYVFWRILRSLRDLRDASAYLKTPVEPRPPGFAPLAPRCQAVA